MQHGLLCKNGFDWLPGHLIPELAGLVSVDPQVYWLAHGGRLPSVPCGKHIQPQSWALGLLCTWLETWPAGQHGLGNWFWWPVLSKQDRLGTLAWATCAWHRRLAGQPVQSPGHGVTSEARMKANAWPSAWWKTPRGTWGWSACTTGGSGESHSLACSCPWCQNCACAVPLH